LFNNNVPEGKIFFQIALVLINFIFSQAYYVKDPQNIIKIKIRIGRLCVILYAYNNLHPHVYNVNYV